MTWGVFLQTSVVDFVNIREQTTRGHHCDVSILLHACMQVCVKDFSFHLDTSNEGWPQESIRKGRAEIHPLLLGPLDAKRNEGSGLSTGMETLWREQAIS